MNQPYVINNWPGGTATVTLILAADGTSIAATVVSSVVDGNTFRLVIDLDPAFVGFVHVVSSAATGTPAAFPVTSGGGLTPAQVDQMTLLATEIVKVPRAGQTHRFMRAGVAPADVAVGEVA